MSTLKPIQALSLDSVQQQSFIKFYKSLPEKPPTTVRIFDRNDYFSVHDVDATTAAKEVFSSLANIKMMGVEPSRMDYLVLSKGNFEILVKKLLLVRRYRVEIYVTEGSVKGNDWELKYKASPGCFSQLEDVLSDGMGVSEENAPCLMAVNIKTDPVSKGRLLGVAFITACEYQMSVTEFTDDDLLTQLETVTVQMAPSECLVPASDTDEFKALKKVMERAKVTVTKLKKTEFSTEGLIQDLTRLLKFKDDQKQDANVFTETTKEVAMTSLAAAVKYMSLMSDSSNFGRYRISTTQVDYFLHLDSAALGALNVFPELGDVSHSRANSLYSMLDHCRTQHGKRLLAQWLRQPLRDINLINERLDIVQVLVENSALRLQLHDDHLRRIPDLQALARRLTRKKANLQDCYKIYQAITRIPPLLTCLSTSEHACVHSLLTQPLAELRGDLHKYQLMMQSTLDMDAVERGDYLVKPSFDEQLQSLATQLERVQNLADKELSKAARDLGLEAEKTIKLENNSQYGFCFRVTLKEEQGLRGKKKYTILDAVKSGVRFKTSTLDELNDDYNQAKTTYETEQAKVVTEIVSIAAGYSECLFCLSHMLSRLDVLVAFSIASATAPAAYTRPVLTESLDELVLKDARHPCLELMEGVSFIPNDVVFKRDKSLMHIVTGANMGGKSTWMRSAGSIVVLAHAGCFVPCSKAIIPILRSVCARVGAHDMEQAGQSTFMLEMQESTHILKTATPDSLVLVDELGRGTSTYEGCGIAWAIAEELATKTKCFTLFATHYHELTRLPSLHPGVIVNSHAEASVVDDQLVLLHRISGGAATQSLGLHVARLADLPDSIIEYAEAKQAQLETNLFDIENSGNSNENSEGQQIIVEFLRKCKEIEQSAASDEIMLKKINDLKNDLFQHNNQYVKSLIAA
ncbi:DNA mismatch repair protein Msh2 [Plutella xylostella]|uniref:DNA mismatch repair protein Msh2 n=1 Tax=Plutella xylostella TaxID=51655 RepID=UPI002032B8A9|nr:DNA mismatch repair protein Msh2 [Plutella xylostella]